MVRAPCGIINNIESKYLCSNYLYNIFSRSGAEKIPLQGVISNLRCFYVDQGVVKQLRYRNIKQKMAILNFVTKNGNIQMASVEEMY